MTKAQIAVSLAALLVSLTTRAEGQNGIGGSLRILTEETDNARRTSDNEISERQDTATANVVALYENDLVALNSNYSISNTRYSEDSQDERTSNVGTTAFRLGKSHHLAELLVSHSRQKVLASAELVDLEENNDERQILTVQPMLHTSSDSTNVFLAQASATDVQYRFEEERDSTRTGAAAGWQRALSPVDSMALVASYTDVEFDSAPSANYQMQVITIKYGAELRRLQYSLEVGQSTTETEVGGADESEPYYSGDLSFNSGYNEYYLSASQKISDSSFGAGPPDLVGDPGGVPGDTGARNQEQMLVRLARARWSSSLLCERCQLSVQIFHDDREYLGVTRKERALVGDLGLSYRLSNASTLGIRFNRREQTFSQAEVIERADFTLDDVSIYYDYQFANSINMRLLLSQEEQTSEDLAREYEELRAGISLAYIFR